MEWGEHSFRERAKHMGASREAVAEFRHRDADSWCAVALGFSA